MRKKYSLAHIKEKSYKKEDAWWTVLVIDPIACRIVWLLSNFLRVHPNYISILGLITSILAGLFFSGGGLGINLLLGAIFFEISFLMDCVDGKLARIIDKSSKVGAILDICIDKLRVLFAIIGIAKGYGVDSVLLLIFLFLNLFYHSIRLFIHKAIKDFSDSDNIHDALTQRKDVKSGLLKKIKKWMHRKRLRLLPYILEQEMLAFFLFPILSYITTSVKILYLGFILSSIMMLIVTMINLLKIGHKIDINEHDE